MDNYDQINARNKINILQDKIAELHHQIKCHEKEIDINSKIQHCIHEYYDTGLYSYRDCAFSGGRHSEHFPLMVCVFCHKEQGFSDPPRDNEMTIEYLKPTQEQIQTHNNKKRLFIETKEQYKNICRGIYSIAGNYNKPPCDHCAGIIQTTPPPLFSGTPKDYEEYCEKLKEREKIYKILRSLCFECSH